MKRWAALILVLVMVLGMAGCGGSTKEPEPTATPEPTPEPTAKERLNEQERQLFDVLISMSADFYNPNKIRILDIGDYIENDRIISDNAIRMVAADLVSEGYYNNNNDAINALLEYLKYGPSTVIIKLQGENRVGGTLTEFYKLLIMEGKKNPDSEEIYDVLNKRGTAVGDKAFKTYADYDKKLFSAYVNITSKFIGEMGSYTDLGSAYTISKQASDFFNVGNINKALVEYWEEMGL